VITLKTGTGIEVDRGFSYEPDLLFELEGDEFTAERLPEVLKARDYQRFRDYRWSKPLSSGVMMDLDVFSMPGVAQDELPVPMTVLPDAQLALKHKRTIEIKVGNLPLSLAVPDAAGFLAMKVRAKLEHRPKSSPGVRDVLEYASSLEPTEQELLAQAVVDLFSEF
jgi:hypothetical protein